MTFVPTKAKWTKPLKGSGRVLKDPEGYRMKLKKKKEDTHYYVCSESVRLRCPFSLVLRIEDEMILKTMNDHNHDNDLLKQEVKKIVSEKVAIAVENNVSPRAALSDISNKVLSDNGDSSGLAYLPKQASFARMINLMKADKLNAPPVSKSGMKWKCPIVLSSPLTISPF